MMAQLFHHVTHTAASGHLHVNDIVPPERAGHRQRLICVRPVDPFLITPVTSDTLIIIISDITIAIAIAVAITIIIITIIVGTSTIIITIIVITSTSTSIVIVIVIVIDYKPMSTLLVGVTAAFATHRIWCPFTLQLSAL
jgi:hypothetical protein